MASNHSRRSQLITTLFIAVAALSLMGFGRPARLDDAQLGEIRIATAEELSRSFQAREKLMRSNVYRRLSQGRYDALAKWPLIRVTFSTKRSLLASVQAYFCNTNIRLETSEVMWEGRLLNDALQMDDGAKAAAKGTREYELIISYNYGKPIAARTDAVVLLPPKGDVCLSTIEAHGHSLKRGKPLRIDATAIQKLLGPLPREIAQ